MVTDTGRRLCMADTAMATGRAHGRLTDHGLAHDRLFCDHMGRMGRMGRDHGLAPRHAMGPPLLQGPDGVQGLDGEQGLDGAHGRAAAQALAIRGSTRAPDGAQEHRPPPPPPCLGSHRQILSLRRCASPRRRRSFFIAPGNPKSLADQRFGLKIRRGCRSTCAPATPEISTSDGERCKSSPP